MKQKLLKLMLLLVVSMMGVSVWGQSYEELFSIASGSVVSGSSYGAYTKTVDGRSYVITFGGNNKSVGTNDNNRGSCNLSSYSAYAVSPVTTGSTASAFACNTELSDVSKISYTIKGTGKNASSTNVYLLYSADNNTFSQLSLTSGTQGASIVTGAEETAFEFSAKSGYFALLFVATNNSGNWRIDDVEISFYKSSSAAATTTTISASGITNTDVYTGTAAGTLTASVTADGSAVDGATVTWSGNNDAVATIDATTGAVTLVGEGTVTFTASYAGVTDEYKASSDTYEMTVVDNTPDPYMYVEVELSDLTASDVFVIVGTHSKGSYAMTNDNGTSSAPTAQSVTISSGKISSNVKDNMKWNISGDAENGYTFYPNGTDDVWLYCNTTAESGSNTNMRVGTGERKVFELSSNNLITKDSNKDRYVSVYPDGPDWRGYTSKATQLTTFKFYKAVDATYTRAVSAGWGTLCLPYAATVEGVQLYEFAGKEMDGTEVKNFVFAEASSVEAGTPYAFKAAAATTLVATFTGGVYAAAGNNKGMVGTYDGVAAGSFSVTGDLYLMTLTQVVNANPANSSVGANRAYFDMANVEEYDPSADVKGIRLGFDGTETPTGINGLTPTLSQGEGAIYNLNGQQLAAPQRGINIIGGKKVLVK